MSDLNDEACARLLQAIILSAIEAVTTPQNLSPKDSIPPSRKSDQKLISRVEFRHKKAMAETVRKGIEFARREPNPFLGFYEEIFGADVLYLRQRIVTIGRDKLHKLGYEEVEQAISMK